MGDTGWGAVCNICVTKWAWFMARGAAGLQRVSGGCLVALLVHKQGCQVPRRPYELGQGLILMPWLLKTPHFPWLVSGVKVGVALILCSHHLTF